MRKVKIKLKNKWKSADLGVFEIKGLEHRMQALIEKVRQYSEEIGHTYVAYFSNKTGDEFYPHVAC